MQKTSFQNRDRSVNKLKEFGSMTFHIWNLLFAHLQSYEEILESMPFKPASRITEAGKLIQICSDAAFYPSVVGVFFILSMYLLT